MLIDDRLKQAVNNQPYPLLFATVSGAHLYGFPSPDSDYDLRGVHILPVADVVGLETGRETIEVSEIRDGLELDLVTHDIRKFFLLLLKNNGYVLEQLYSPLIVHATPEHEELKEIAKGCITKHHVHHYLGFSQTQWRLFEKEQPHRVKPLLYTFRVLLTGIHLMQTGKIEANLPRLNEEAKLSYLDDLIAMKVSGAEQATLNGADISFYELEYHRLKCKLEEAYNKSTLPEQPCCRVMLDNLLIRLRLQPLENSRMTCPVCGLAGAFTKPDAYEICPRCGWEDDLVQSADPNYCGGANKESLNEARAHRDEIIARWQNIRKTHAK